MEHTPRTAAEFDLALAAVRSHVGARVGQVVTLVEPILAKHLQLVRALDRLTAATVRELSSDVRAQLAELIRPGFVADTGLARLPDLDRYLRAALHRLDKAPEDLRRDAQRRAEVLAVEARYAAFLAQLRPGQRGAEAVTDIAWMLEELRVSLFAQNLGTAYPVSAKRIDRALAAARTSVGEATG